MLNRVVKASAIFTAGNMLPLLTSVVLLFPYTENLSTALYGELALYIAFTIFVQFTANYGLDNYVGIHHFKYKKNDEEMRQFVGSVVGALLALGLGLILFFVAVGGVLFDVVFQAQLKFYPFGIMCVATGVFNAFFRTYINFLFYRDKPVRHIIFNLFNFLVTVAICTVGVYKYPESLIGPIWGRFLSGALIFMLALIFFYREYGIRFNKSYLKDLHKFCFPVYIYMLLGWVVFYINTFIINFFSTTSDVGIYDFALKCVLLIDVTQTAIAQTINPRIYQIWSDHKLERSTKGENRFHNVFSMFSILFIAANVVALPLIVQLFVRNEGYYAIFEYLPILCAAFAFRMLANQFYNPLMYFKKTGALPRSLAWSSLIQIVACVVLMQFYGLWGAVWSYFISKVAVVFFTWFESRKIFDFKLNPYKMIALPLIYATVLILLNFLVEDYFTMAFIQLFFALAITLLVFRKELSSYKLLLSN